FEGIEFPSSWTFNSVVNYEGVNGLAWIADDIGNQDPRIPLLYNPTRQDKYTQSNANLVVASGIQARLIEAEHYLNDRSHTDDWLNTINSLRNTIGLSDTLPTDTSFSNKVDLLY